MLVLHCKQFSYIVGHHFATHDQLTSIFDSSLCIVLTIRDGSWVVPQLQYSQIFQAANYLRLSNVAKFFFFFCRFAKQFQNVLETIRRSKYLWIKFLLVANPQNCEISKKFPSKYLGYTLSKPKQPSCKKRVRPQKRPR